MNLKEKLFVLFITLLLISMVVGLIMLSVKTLGFEEFIERLKRLEKWMW